MSQNWPTKNEDLQTARLIMEEYARENESEALGLLEIVVDQNQKKMDFCISGWVIQIAKHFNALYGASHGDFITRQVISSCITQGHTIH